MHIDNMDKVKKLRHDMLAIDDAIESINGGYSGRPHKLAVCDCTINIDSDYILKALNRDRAAIVTAMTDLGVTGVA